MSALYLKPGYAIDKNANCWLMLQNQNNENTEKLL